MRRDLFHFYPCPVKDVFSAYQKAANERFGKNCRMEPYHTVSFGLNFSFRYNMNGGACTVHLMPHQNGTAVNVRYTIVQLAGARYGAYDKELTRYVDQILGVPARDIQLNADSFLLPQNQVTPSTPASNPAPAAAAYIPTPAAYTPTPAAPAAPAPQPQAAQPVAEAPAAQVAPAVSPLVEALIAQEAPAEEEAPAPAPQPAPEPQPSAPVYKPTLTLEPHIRTTRFCDQCGSRLLAGAKFCDQCGNRIG